MYILQILIINMCINLCRRNTRMSQQSLYSTQICSFFQQRCSKTMPQNMWCHFLFDSYQIFVIFDQCLYRISTK